MLESIRQKLEANGILVIEKPFDFHFKTRTFIRLPDGQTLAYYDYMHEIPDTLYNGEEISLGEQAIPEGEPIYVNQSGKCTDSNCGTIWDGDNAAASFDGQLIVVPPGFIALIIFLIKLIAVFIVIYLIMEKWLHPCGPVATHEDVDTCVKVITYPDCSTLTIDSCNVDEQGNPKPKVINRTSPPGPDIGQIIIYGIVGIAAIIVLLEIMKYRRRQPAHAPPSERPAYKPNSTPT